MGNTAEAVFSPDLDTTKEGKTVSVELTDSSNVETIEATASISQKAEKKQRNSSQTEGNPRVTISKKSTKIQK